VTIEVQKEDQDEKDYTSVEYWKPHFDDECQLDLRYYTVDDGTKLLGVYAKNLQHPDTTPVIIVPGWFSMVFGWSEVTQELSKHTSILYLETREKVSSILPNHKVEMSVQRMADDFTQISHLIPFKIKDSIVISSSMGGTMMLEYLGRMVRPPKISVMIGPNPEFDIPKKLTKLLLFSPLFIVEPFKAIIKFYIRRFKVDMKKEPQQYYKYANVLDAAEPWKIRQSARECLWYEAWELLEDADIESRVILVGASADKMHDEDQTMKVHDVIEGSEFVDFPSNKATHSREMAEYIVDLLE